MQFINTCNCRSQKPLLFPRFFFYCLLTAFLLAHSGIGFAGVYGQPEVKSNVTDRSELPTVLYSLQINTYVYESAALRAYDALPGDLQPDAFVYKTDSGYYTLRLGRAANRDDLLTITEKLAVRGYNFIQVRTDPHKVNNAAVEMLQTAEPGRETGPETEAAAPAEQMHAAEVATEKVVSASQQQEAAAAEVSGQKAGISLYEDDMTEVYVLPTGGNSIKLSLEDAIRVAVDQNPDIKVAAFLSPIAEEEKKSTHTVYDPSLFAESNISRTDRPIQSKLDLGEGDTESDSFVEDRWGARAGIKQPLPTGGILSLSVLDVDHLDSSSDLVIPNPQYTSRLTLELRQALLKEFGDPTNRSAMELADLNLNVSGMEYRKTMANVMREVGTYYWRLVYYAKQISISRKYLQDAEDIYQRLLLRKESGLADLLDVDRALASVQDRKAIFIKANTDYKLAMDQLKLLLGFASGAAGADVAIIPTERLSSKEVELDKAALLQEALLKRPEYSIAQNRVSAAEINRKLARHMRLPTLDARAMYAFNALGEDFSDDVKDTYFSDDNSWAVGLEFVWPIGGRKAEADYLKVVYEEKQSQAALAKISEEINFQINSSVTEIEQSAKEIEATGNSRQANHRLLSREKSRFEIRQVNIHSLLDAQDDYYFAYRTYIRSISNYNISMLKLKWAKGTILEDFGIMQKN